MNLTQNELTVINAIAINEYNMCNWGIPQNHTETTTYVWAVTDTMLHEEKNIPTGKSFSGVVSSLTKKNLVNVQGNGEDATIGLTESGFNIWKLNREKK